MQRRYYGDWIAWTLAAAILVVGSAEYYRYKTTGETTTEYVYKIVVTPQTR